MPARPDYFWIDPTADIWRGCQFAGLGCMPGTKQYRDSSLYARDGLLTGYTGAGNAPASRWSIDTKLRRSVLGFNGSGDYVIPPTMPVVPPLTLACWVLPPISSINSCMFAYGSLYTFSLRNGQIYFRTNTATNVAYTWNPTWTHFAVTWDMSHNVLFWINGVSRTPTTNPTNTDETTGINEIGVRSGVDYLLGSLADALVFRAVCSSEQIALLANPVRSIDYDGAFCWLRGRSQVSFAPSSISRRRRLLCGV